jgi:hypothetical protein
MAHREPTASISAGAVSTRSSSPRCPRHPRGTGECRSLRTCAASCGVSVTRVRRRFGSASDPEDAPDCHGKEGSPVRVRQRALEPHYRAVFSFRSGSADPFLALPSEKGSSIAAGRRCATVRWTAERFLSRPRYRRGTPGARFGCDARRTVGAAFAADHRGRAGGPAVRLHAWLVTAVSLARCPVAPTSACAVHRYSRSPVEPEALLLLVQLDSVVVAERVRSDAPISGGSGLLSPSRVAARGRVHGQVAEARTHSRLGTRPRVRA